MVQQNTEFEEDPNCVNSMTLVRVFGDSSYKFNVKWVLKNECTAIKWVALKNECTAIKWVAADNDFPSSKGASVPDASLDEMDETKIRFKNLDITSFLVASPQN